MALIGDELFGARGKLKAGLDYQAPEKYAPKAEDFIVVEQKAAWISTYEGAHVPGLLQTPEYARALMEDRCPPLSDNTIEHRVAARMERRQLLAESADPPVEYSCVLLEVVLRMPVGGRDVHRRQASWLLEAGRQRNVSIQVLPFERVTSSALAGPLVVLETKEEEQFGYLEVHMHGSLTNSREEVNALLRRHGKIRMRALSDEDSARLIERMVEEL